MGFARRITRRVRNSGRGDILDESVRPGELIYFRKYAPLYLRIASEVNVDLPLKPEDAALLLTGAGEGDDDVEPAVNVLSGVPSTIKRMNVSVVPSAPPAALPSRLKTFSSTNCLCNVCKINFSDASQQSENTNTSSGVRRNGSLSLLLKALTAKTA